MAEVLSQDEIDDLLGLGEDSGSNVADGLLSNEDGDEENRMILYDFKRPNRVSKEQLRAIRGIHEKLSRGVSSKISAVMRTIVEVQLHSVEQMSYGEFLISLPSPTSFNIFSMKPLDGSFILELNPVVAFSIIDRLLGGNGDSYSAVREFTDIEFALFDIIFKIFMKEIKEAWKPIIETFPHIEEKESSSNVVQIVAQNEFVIMCVMEIVVGDVSGIVNLCYPVIYLEQIFQKLLKKELNLGDFHAQKSRNKELRTLVGGTDVVLEAMLGHTRIELSKLLKLKKGDIIIFDKPADDEVIVRVDGKNKFIAQIGSKRYRKTIKIRQIVETDKDFTKTVLEDLEKERARKLTNMKEEVENEHNRFF
jgi:flagellar motor switch protein FliM